MRQGVLTNKRVRLLLDKNSPNFRERRKGSRKKKSVRGCIVDANLSVLNVIIVKCGEKDIEGLTDTTRPRRLGPKRANNIRKLFNLSKEDDVRKFAVRRVVKREGKRNIVKKPKIQRLVTPRRIARKKAEYVWLLMFPFDLGRDGEAGAETWAERRGNWKPCHFGTG